MLSTVVSTLVLSFMLMMVAELGDNSQIMTIVFSFRYPKKTIVLGISIAAMVITALAVIVGKLLLVSVPHWVLDSISIGMLLFFTVHTFFTTIEVHNTTDSGLHSWSWLTIAGTFIVAELGDKTMFTAANLAINHNLALVWLGGTLGLIASNSMVLLIKKSVLSRVNLHYLKYIVATVFCGMTIWEITTSSLSATIKNYAYALALSFFLIVLCVDLYRTRTHHTSPSSTAIITPAENFHSPASAHSGDTSAAKSKSSVSPLTLESLLEHEATQPV